MRIALCTAVWQRYALAPIWWQGVSRLQRRFAAHGLTLTVTVAGSEPTHQRLALLHNAAWIPVENRPLGAKWNAAVEAACRSGADYLLILGSDDFLSDAVVDRYAVLIREGWYYLGLGSLYFYEPRSDRLALYNLCRGRYGSPLGAGRLLHRTLLEPQGFRPWLDCLNRALDADMRRRCDLPPGRLLHMGGDLVAVDVKTDTNIWSFDRLAEAYPALDYRTSPLPIPEWPALAQLGRAVA